MVEKTFKQIPLVMLILVIMISLAYADQLSVFGSIQSQNGLYYTTMSPNTHYLAMGDQRSPGAGVDIIDISNPAEMTLAGTVHTGHMTYQLDWAGDYIYCPASWDGLFIYNASNLGNIAPVFDTSFGSPVTSVAVRNNIALVGGVVGMYAFDISNPYNPIIRSHQPGLSYSWIVLGDTVAYAYSIYTQILFINISDPANPQLISTFNCPDVDGIEIDEANHRMFLVSQTWDFRIYDIQDVTHPTLVGHTAIDGWCIDVDYSSSMPDRVVVSAYTGGVCVIDISNPSAPVLAANWLTPGQSNYVLINKDIIYNTSPDLLYSLVLSRNGLSTDDGSPTPSNPGLAQNYPNPFNSSTNIKFSLPETTPATLEIYNIIGQKVSVLFDGIANAGTNATTWDASRFPSGQYFYRLSAPGIDIRKPMVLLK